MTGTPKKASAFVTRPMPDQVYDKLIIPRPAARFPRKSKRNRSSGPRPLEGHQHMDLGFAGVVLVGVPGVVGVAVVFDAVHSDAVIAKGAGHITIAGRSGDGSVSEGLKPGDELFVGNQG